MPPDRLGLGVRMDDVASSAGVSRATVSRVLAGTARVSPEAEARVREAMTRLGYVPNTSARSLARGGNRLVGLLIRDPRNPAYGLLHAETQAAADEHGVELITVTATPFDRSRTELAGLRRLLGLRVAGLLVATGVVRSDDLQPFLSEVPVVSVGRVETHPGIRAVGYDEEANAVTVADAVLAAGHRGIAVVSPSPSVSHSEHARANALVRRFAERGAVVVPLSTTVFGLQTDRYEDAVTLVREGAITAVCFTSDTRALGFLDHAEAAGLDIPGDVSVTGFDAVLPGIERLGLASVRIPVEQVARRSIELIAHLLDDADEDGLPAPVHHERLAGQWCPGRSLAAPRLLTEPEPR
ncbi:LacI family DNA-binding transcriptional regulator [Tsukamurella pulmonis]|uniref:LacI family DNA-binding transcriptional regulator n=1 Tax=Tsukamurella pulmonis TaxID=47312 RepID=UPI00105914CD|nr:LacI family DNA-binding transcriptional regulator [Tsukamurella pulmonis]